MFTSCFLLISFSLQKEEYYKNKKEKRENLDQFLTFKQANLGPVFDSTAYIYVCIFMYVYIWGTLWFSKGFLCRVGAPNFSWNTGKHCRLSKPSFAPFLEMPILVVLRAWMGKVACQTHWNQSGPKPCCSIFWQLLSYHGNFVLQTCCSENQFHDFFAWLALCRGTCLPEAASQSKSEESTTNWSRK